MDHMRILHDAKEKAWGQLEEVLRRNDPPEKAVDHMYKLIKIIKNGGEAEMLEEYAEGESYGYESGNSYARGGRRHYVRAHYSRDGEDPNARMDSRRHGESYDRGESYGRGYSDRHRRGYSGDEEEFRGMLREAMECAEDDQHREIIRQCIEKLDRM